MRLSLLFILLSTLFSCDGLPNWIQKDTKETAIEETSLSGTYFELEKDNISIFLPKYFNGLTPKEYEEDINAIENPILRSRSLKKLNVDKFSPGNVYYFKDLTGSTTITVKMMPYYYPFSREDSSQLLGILSQSCRQNSDSTLISCRKLKAGYSGNAKTKVFKAVFEVTNHEDNQLSYKNIYLISSNNKSFSVDMHSTISSNYDGYIEKIKVKS